MEGVVDLPPESNPPRGLAAFFIFARDLLRFCGLSVMFLVRIFVDALRGKPGLVSDLPKRKRKKNKGKKVLLNSPPEPEPAATLSPLCLQFLVRIFYRLWGIIAEEENAAPQQEPEETEEPYVGPENIENVREREGKNKKGKKKEVLSKDAAAKKKKRAELEGKDIRNQNRINHEGTRKTQKTQT